MLNTANHLEVQIKNHNEILPYTYQNGYLQKDHKTNVGQGYGEKRTLVPFWECKLVPPLWKTIWWFLKIKTELPYDPIILLLGIYLEKNNLKRYMLLFLQVLAIVHLNCLLLYFLLTHFSCTYRKTYLNQKFCFIIFVI